MSQGLRVAHMFMNHTALIILCIVKGQQCAMNGMCHIFYTPRFYFVCSYSTNVDEIKHLASIHLLGISLKLVTCSSTFTENDKKLFLQMVSIF